MRVNALAQVILVRIYIALVPTIDYMMSVHVVYIKEMESNAVRYCICLLNMMYLRVFGSSPMLSSIYSSSSIGRVLGLGPRC